MFVLSCFVHCCASLLVARAEQNMVLRKKSDILARNISCIFKTARNEIELRDAELALLRKRTQQDNRRIFAARSPMGAPTASSTAARLPSLATAFAMKRFVFRLCSAQMNFTLIDLKIVSFLMYYSWRQWRLRINCIVIELGGNFRATSGPKAIQRRRSTPRQATTPANNSCHWRWCCCCFHNNINNIDVSQF
jgi:hypothetical protein